MNDLNLATVPTADPRIFDTYWQTGLLQKGRINITLPRFLDDGRTAAELVAARYLLEEKNACGHKKTGAGLRIRTSCSSIPDLLKGELDKSYLSPYANFLRTRFMGAEIQVCEAPYEWADDLCESQVDFVAIEKPTLTVIDVNGIGPVEVTAHAMEKYALRFERPPERAWRDMVKISREVELAVLRERSVMSDLKHKRPARYMLHENRDVLLIIADPEKMGGLPRLVTVVKPEGNAQVANPVSR
jgi:hypothetical protein